MFKMLIINTNSIFTTENTEKYEKNFAKNLHS